MSQLKSATAGNGGAAAHSPREPFALSDQQWTALAPLVPGADSANRGRLAAPQRVLEGILYAIRNGLGMQSVQPPYPSGSTLYRRYTAWTASGQWDAIWAAFLDTLSPAERREWEAAARRRPGAAAEAADEPAPPAPAAERPAAVAVDSAAQPAPINGPTDERRPAIRAAEAVPLEGRVPAGGIAPDAAPRQPDAQRNGYANQAQDGEHRNGFATPGEAPAPTFESNAQSPQVTLDMAHDRVTRRLGLSAAESEIVRRRIDDHGVAAALLALDEVEGRLATGMMRGVGGMPMSAFEIWVCAVGLARRPVERPRLPRPERGERNDGDRDRRKRQWRKAP